MPRYYYTRRHLGSLKVDRQALRLGISYTPTPRARDHTHFAACLTVNHRAYPVFHNEHGARRRGADSAKTTVRKSAFFAALRPFCLQLRATRPRGPCVANTLHCYHSSQPTIGS